MFHHQTMLNCKQTADFLTLKPGTLQMFTAIGCFLLSLEFDFDYNIQQQYLKQSLTEMSTAHRFKTAFGQYSLGILIFD